MQIDEINGPDGGGRESSRRTTRMLKCGTCGMHGPAVWERDEAHPLGHWADGQTCTRCAWDPVPRHAGHTRFHTRCATCGKETWVPLGHADTGRCKRCGGAYAPKIQALPRVDVKAKPGTQMIPCAICTVDHGAELARPSIALVEYRLDADALSRFAWTESWDSKKGRMIGETIIVRPNPEKKVGHWFVCEEHALYHRGYTIHLEHSL